MNNTPYISVPELLNAPTGINWDTIPTRDATDDEKQAEYLQLTRRGTAWVNTACRQTLNAALDYDTVRVGSRRCGWTGGVLKVFTRFSPIISLPGIEVSRDGSLWTSMEGQSIITGSQAFQLLSPSPSGDWIRTGYIHGFVNTSLSSDVSASDQSVDVYDATGVFPGTELSIYDGVDYEPVVVASSYVSGLTLPLVDELVSDHVANTRISAMPPEIREATQLAVIHYVRMRGRSAITVQPTGGARSIVAVNQLEEFTEAKGLLNPYRRVL